MSVVERAERWKCSVLDTKRRRMMMLEQSSTVDLPRIPALPWLLLRHDTSNGAMRMAHMMDQTERWWLEVQALERALCCFDNDSEWM